MTTILDNTKHFGNITARTLHNMFGVEVQQQSDAAEVASVQTSKTFLVTVYYTGTVYGEYLLAMDEVTAAKVTGIGTEITDENRREVRESVCDAMAETLNTIVGEAIVRLQQSHAKLTLTAPRVVFGEIRYPEFKTGKITLTTTCGEIECHFCLDLMRLDLATSYQDAITNLLDVNTKLKEANRHLAEQQAQLVHSEKMASVGVLASGVAHEINNPLAFIEGNFGTLEQYMTVVESIFSLYEKLCESLRGLDGCWIPALQLIQQKNQEQDIEFVLEDTRQLMEESREGIARIKQIVQALRDFSQVDQLGFVEADLNFITANALALVAGRLPQGCEVEQQFGQLSRIECNSAEIGQAIAGILINAGQAVQENGRISLRTAMVGADAVLMVEDNGHGIDPKHIDHIFEPFFTTREVGSGVGLGLSIAYGIIRKHNGSISITSTPGAGTKVTLRFPVACETGLLTTPLDGS